MIPGTIRVSFIVFASLPGHRFGRTLCFPGIAAGTAQATYSTTKLKMDYQSSLLAVSAVNLGISLFCANQLFLRQRHQRVYLMLILFFAVQSLDETLNIAQFFLKDHGNQRQLARLFSLAYPITLAQPLLFWLYVRALTSEDTAIRISHKVWHAVPFVLSISLVVSIFMLPKSFFANPDADFSSVGLIVQLTVIQSLMTEFAFYIQVSVYLFLTMRMLSAYRSRLKDLFATTENRELSWVWWITTIVGAYLLLSIGELVALVAGLEVSESLSDATNLADGMSSLAITWVIAIWGLRQQPGLVRNLAESDTGPGRSNAGQAKYERSALTDEHAERIAGKIGKAMAEDLLYRDPNLSLWDLAKHISVTSSYVSQTLNMTLNSNFFDYVNKWRIQDAVKQLQDTDETILVIAYDVGFNSRSSFYNAFKKEMGMTPSALRAKKS